MKATITVNGLHSTMRAACGVCTPQFLFGSRKAVTKENVSVMLRAGIVMCNDGLMRIDPVIAERNGNPYLTVN